MPNPLVSSTPNVDDFENVRGNSEAERRRLVQKKDSSILDNASESFIQKVTGKC